MTVENVVIKTEFGCDLNLDFIKLALGNEAEFKPDKFPGIIFKPTKKERGRETILVFRTGRLICTGVKSPEEGKKLILDFVERLRNLGVEIPEHPKTEPHSASEIDEKIMEVLGRAENVYTNYCLYADGWSTPRGHAGGFVKRWIDRKQVAKELESMTARDVKQILERLSLLADREHMKILHSIMEDKKTLEEISQETGIEPARVKECLENLRKARLQWGAMEEEEGKTFVAWGGRVTLHLLSMISKMVLEPSEWSIVGREELYR